MINSQNSLAQMYDDGDLAGLRRIRDEDVRLINKHRKELAKAKSDSRKSDIMDWIDKLEYDIELIDRFIEKLV